ncbi:MAG: glycosyltransferase [Candidatus Eremiobacteraeota bacterium]|nr:glycosyltransferase [Candidatus Eremiobacteraeota bacterium]
MLVSCVLVTLRVPERLGYFKSSVAAYCAQTYAHRELVVVADRGEPAAKDAIRAHLASLQREDIRLVDIDEKLTLGALRNAGSAGARGDAIAQWDDDDLHHPRRLETQLAKLAAANARSVYLEEVMQFFPATRELYCINFRSFETKAHPGTGVVRRSAEIAYPENGDEARLGEDTHVCLRLREAGGFAVLAGAPHLYVYVSHGANAWPQEHHRMLAERLTISRGLLLRRERTLREGLKSYDFGPGPVTVKGYNGEAFMLVRQSSYSKSPESTE